MNKRVLFTASAQFKVSRFASESAAPANGAQTDQKERKNLAGYAILWNQLSDDRGGYYVRFLKDSAKFATPTFAIFHHDFRCILGSTANSTLRLTSDDIGVRVEIDLPDTTQASDVAKLVEGGYVGGMSFSMLYDDVLVTTSKTENDQDIVEVSAFTCDEVTVTAIPAYTGTSIGVKHDDLARLRNNAPERVSQSLKLARLELAARNL